VGALEAQGIGRPSTYAPTMRLLQVRVAPLCSTCTQRRGALCPPSLPPPRRRVGATCPQARGFAQREGRALHATPLGRVLSSFLSTYFPAYVDYGFTAGLEDKLDAVSGEDPPLVSCLVQYEHPLGGLPAAACPVQRVAPRGILTAASLVHSVNHMQLLRRRRQLPLVDRSAASAAPAERPALPFPLLQAGTPSGARCCPSSGGPSTRHWRRWRASAAGRSSTRSTPLQPARRCLGG
jgi:hypothetical protein